MTSKAENSSNQGRSPEVAGWPIKDLWEKYEDIAMHFNDLLMKLRTQALAAVAAISALVGVFGKNGSIDGYNWEVATGVFFFLSVFWIAIWIIDFCYYNRLLLGAVDAIVDLEILSKTATHVRYIDISIKIERAVAADRTPVDAERSTRRKQMSFGRWAFYLIVCGALLIGFLFSAYHLLPAVPPAALGE